MSVICQPTSEDIKQHLKEGRKEVFYNRGSGRWGELLLDSDEGMGGGGRERERWGQFYSRGGGGGVGRGTSKRRDGALMESPIMYIPP